MPSAANNLSSSTGAAALLSTTTSSHVASLVDKVDQVVLQVGDVHSLLLLLKSPDVALCCSVLDTITKYALDSKQHREYLQDQDLLTMLVGILAKPPALCDAAQFLTLKKHVTACLAATTNVEPMTPAMRHPSLVAALLNLAQTEDNVEVLDETWTALAHVAREYGTKNTIRQANGIKTLVAHMALPDPDVRRSATQALVVLADDFACRSEIRQLGGLSALLDGSASEYPEIQDLALTGLSKMAQDSACRVELRKLNGHKKLADLLVAATAAPTGTTPAPATATPAGPLLAALASLLADADMNSAMAGTSVAETVSKLLGKEDAKTKRAAAQFLGTLGRVEANQASIRETGGFTALLNGLSHPDPAVVAASASALHVILAQDSNEPEILKSNVYDLLLQRMNDQDVREPVLLALSSCFLYSKPRARARINPPGLADLLRTATASVTDPSTIPVASAAATCLAHLSDDEGCRQELVRQDAVAALLQALQATTPPVAAIALALAKLMQEPAARTAFKPAGGVDVTVKLLATADAKHEWTTNVCAMVASASRLADCAQAFCSTGTPTQLHALHTPAALTALDTLLDHHLPARYWSRRRLDAHHRTHNAPFYDYPSTATDFPSLESIRTLPPDPRRAPTLLIDPASPVIRSAVTQLTAELGTVPVCNSALTAPSVNTPSRLLAVARAVTAVLGPAAEGGTAVAGALAAIQLAKRRHAIDVADVPPGAASTAHRAMVFKVLADAVGLWAGLVKGEYGRCWNTAVVDRASVEGNGVEREGNVVPSGERVTVVVDLETPGGKVLVYGSVEAKRYTRL
ncbi:hypothetical protein AMAG_07871 [Allomyces macrogynus ATCC 38327]|uniref:Uncharacterized protein n=1 Tax=Allomyces macrogynus (strain ATCC 38327) TaxID=578462 RepID=A0A0L0SJK8_ALLM3|nr:hypothetical protein AMAG_07871 [Allomyces macrogynus ATCC 38327]|eukprot:KNE62678.1 hypothetical protein AMAG_07871 [Allomyces macrogynus ATCC 38327]